MSEHNLFYVDPNSCIYTFASAKLLYSLGSKMKQKKHVLLSYIHDMSM